MFGEDLSSVQRKLDEARRLLGQAEMVNGSPTEAALALREASCY